MSIPRLLAGGAALYAAALALAACTSDDPSRCFEPGATAYAFHVPGDTTKSYLLFKLTGENTNGYTTDCSRPMPEDVNGESIPLVRLDPAAVATIRQWIEEGAAFD